jgi:ankyrin repeat protein
MNRICIAALMTVMICASGCGPSERERFEATQKLFSVLKYDDKGGSLGDSIRRGETIRVLIEAGAFVNAKKSDGRTPLMYALRYSSTPEIVTPLIEAGADVNARDGRGYTPLMFAANYASPKVVTLLIEVGANVNATVENGMTPLMFASNRSTTPKVVTLLIEAGADVNAKTNGGKTALTYADYKDDTQVIRILKAAGAKEW